jgi:hypothetical protein
MLSPTFDLVRQSQRHSRAADKGDRAEPQDFPGHFVLDIRRARLLGAPALPDTSPIFDRPEGDMLADGLSGYRGMPTLIGRGLRD